LGISLVVINDSMTCSAIRKWIVCDNSLWSVRDWWRGDIVCASSWVWKMTEGCFIATRGFNNCWWLYQYPGYNVFMFYECFRKIALRSFEARYWGLWTIFGFGRFIANAITYFEDASLIWIHCCLRISLVWSLSSHVAFLFLLYPK
jgi:hypothetical protein